MQIWPEDWGRELPLDIVKASVVVRNDTLECILFKGQFRIKLYVEKVVMFEELSNQLFPLDCTKSRKDPFASLEDHFLGFLPLVDLNATSPQDFFDSILVKDAFKISDWYKLLPKRVRSSQAANAFSNSECHGKLPLVSCSVSLREISLVDARRVEVGNSLGCLGASRFGES